jgi:perosamine synthetase
LTHSVPERAAPGAPAPDGFVPLCVPEIRGNEWKYIKECLDTNWVSSVGSYVDRFEEVLAEEVNTRYAVATVNGTAALHIALHVAGVQPGDEVITSDLTFIAPANAIRYVGAWPVFIDAEPDYWQMDAVKLLSFLRDQCVWQDNALYDRATQRRVRAVLPVHILGHPVDMAPLLQAARAYNLAVIEDATESLGALYRGESVGHLGDIACFSFNGNKLLTTGGGGMIVTDNEDWARKARHLTTQAKDDPLEYTHSEIGYNYRLTNILAAMGVAQMEQLPLYLAAKREIAQCYELTLGSLPGLTLMAEAPWAQSAFWLYTILIDEALFGMNSRQLLNVLAAQKIQARPLWQPMHLSAAHAGAQASDCSVAERLNRDGLSLPCSVGLSAQDQSRVIDAISEAASVRNSPVSVTR